MKRYFKQSLLPALALVLLMPSCEKDKIDTYSGTNDIYFGLSVFETYEYGLDAEVVDSLNISLGYAPVEQTDSLLQLPVRVTGMPMDIDRSYTIKVSEESTAKLGVDFTLPENPVIHAGKVVDSLNVTLLRSEAMKSDTLSIALTFEPNKYFTTNMQDEVTNELTGETLSHVSFTLFVTDILAQPTYWLAPYLGDFSRKKLFLMSDLLNISLGALNGRVPISEVVYYGKFMQRYLNEQAAAGNTIYEEDGNPMQMGMYVQ